MCRSDPTVGPPAGLPALSLRYPGDTADPELLTTLLRVVAGTGMRRLWFGSSDVTDPLADVAAAPEVTGVAVGTAVQPVTDGSAAALVDRCAAVAAASGRTVVAGVGAGSAWRQQQRTGAVWPRPVSAVRDRLRELRTATAARYGDGSAPIRLGVGALRPAMAELAGAAADRLITRLAPPDWISGTLRPAVARGADRADRDPAAVRTTAVVEVAVDRPGREPALLAVPGGGVATSRPHWVAMLDAAGVPVRDHAGAWRNAEILVEHGIFTYADPAGIVATVRRYAAAGVDEVVLDLRGVHTVHGLPGLAHDLLDIARATTRARPAVPGTGGGPSRDRITVAAAPPEVSAPR